MFGFNKEEKPVKIEDTNPDAFKEFLRYIYCEKLNHLNRFALDLLELSDKVS